MTILVCQCQIVAADNDKDVYSIITSQNVIRGLGGFGFKGVTKQPVFPDRPKTAPTAVGETRIWAGQGFLYRLNGDYNPLHVDPDMAKIANFN